MMNCIGAGLSAMGGPQGPRSGYLGTSEKMILKEDTVIQC